MKRWMRKGVATILACAVLIGNFSLAHAEGDKGGNTVDILSDTVYDEAVTFVDNIVFLENGHWPSEETHYDSETHQDVIDEQKSDITVETNIVFMDGDGNKKIISNKDEDGERLFDRVYPAISASDYQMLLLIKEGKAAYLKEDGTFFGGELTWYNYATPITNDFMLVSEDGEYWKAVNSKGEITASNLAITTSSDRVFNRLINTAIGNRLVLKCKDKTVVFNEKGNLLREYDKNLEIWPIENGYMMLRDGEKTQLLDPDGKVVREFDTADLWLSFYSKNYIIATGKDKYIESDTGNSYWEHESNLVNVATGEIIFTGKGSPEFDGEVLVGRDQQDVVSVSSLDGTVYISDLEQYAKDLGKKEGYQSVSSQYTYVNGSLLLSIIDEADTNKTCTFTLTKENGFTENDTKKFDGIVDAVSSNGEYFTTENYEQYLRNMCTSKGKLVRSYEENDKYRSSYGIWKEHPADNRIAGSDDSTRLEGMPGELVFWVGEYSKVEYDGVMYPKQEGTAYITTNGEVSNTYEYVERNRFGNFLSVWRNDGTGQVINSSNEIVYTNKQSTENMFWYYNRNIDIQLFWYYDCFSVKDLESGRCYLYDRDGNIIFGEEGTYLNIGYTEKYHYPLSNGLCVIEKNEGGTSKYGAIVIKGRKAEGLVQLGDVNEDGEIDSKDALAILKYSVGIEQLVFEKEAADVNGDGDIDSKDALMILKHSVGILQIS